MIIGFADRTKTKLTESVTSTATLLPCWGGDLMPFRPGDADTYAVLRDAIGHEVVKVVGIQPFTGLIVQRGQDGSTPRAFATGSIVSARIAKGALSAFLQKGAMRQISYNPNAVTVPAYFGEKIAETGVDGCTHRIWQNVIEGSAQWRIVYGDMCKDLQNYREWNWPIVEYPWPEWPTPIIRPLMHVDVSKIPANDGDSLATFTDLVGNVVDLGGEERAWVAVRSPYTDTTEYFHETNNVYSGGGYGSINNSYSMFMPYVGGPYPWDGVLPNDAVDLSESTHKYVMDGSGRPCIRLGTSCVKHTSYGRPADSPIMTCRSRFSSGTKYTLFFVAAGQSVYKLGRTPSSGFNPAGNTPREYSTISLCGISSDPTYSGIGLGVTKGESGARVNLLAESGNSVLNGKQFKGSIDWIVPTAEDYWGHDNLYGSNVSYPPPSISLISMEIDASNQRFDVYINGVFSETLFNIYDTIVGSSFPISVLHFSSNVYYYNNTYDTIGVTYSCKLDVYEAVLYGMLFSEEDRTSMESQLMEKWGIV